MQHAIENSNGERQCLSRKDNEIMLAQLVRGLQLVTSLVLLFYRSSGCALSGAPKTSAGALPVVCPGISYGKESLFSIHSPSYSEINTNTDLASSALAKSQVCSVCSK
jgi:hypothetical protein